MASLSGFMSETRITEAPAILAACTAFSPTPPEPTTRTESPGRTGAALNTAPVPVSTAQPISAATSIGISSGIFVAQRAGTTASSAKDETAMWCSTSSPLRSRVVPSGMVP